MGQTQKIFLVHDPFNNSKISKVFDAEESGTIRAINSAHDSFKKWRKIPAEQRSNYLKNLYSLVIKNKTNIAEIITRECGKPLKESVVEVEYGASFIEWSANQCLRNCGKIFESPDNSKKMFYTKQPVGVVAAITPWNFPLAMVTRKVSAALAAGCTVVLKPSELTPLTALFLGELSIKAKLPKGVLNIINGEPNMIGSVLSKHSKIKKITFTGSTRVGKLLMKNASATVKNISLELGGNAPFIIFSDADLDSAVDGLMNAKFRNAGQTCISANRVLIQDDVYDIVIEKLRLRLKKLNIGHGLKNCDIGPLISKNALEKIFIHLNDAVKKGS